MASFARVVVLLGVCMVVASPVNSDEILAMRVSTFYPGSLSIRLTIKEDRDNRRLVVSADSPGFYRSSEIQLDGEAAPRTSVFELQGMPTDTYEVTGVLIGVRGPRAKVIRIARVLPETRGR